MGLMSGMREVGESATTMPDSLRARKGTVTRLPGATCSANVSGTA